MSDQPKFNPEALIHTFSMAAIKWPPAPTITDEITLKLKRLFWQLIDDVANRFIPASIEGQAAKENYLLNRGFRITDGRTPEGWPSYRLWVKNRIVGEFRLEFNMGGGDIRVVFEPLVDYHWARKKFPK